MDPASSSELRYRRVLQAVCETPWAILPSKLAVIVELLTLRGATLLSRESRLLF